MKICTHVHNNKEKDMPIKEGILNRASFLKMDIASSKTLAALHITKKKIRKLIFPKTFEKKVIRWQKKDMTIKEGILNHASFSIMDIASLKTDAALHITKK